MRKSTASRRSTVVRPQAEQTPAEDEQPRASVEEEAEAEAEAEAPPSPPLTIDHEAALELIDREGEAEEEAEPEPEAPPSPPLPAGSKYTEGEASPSVLSSSDAAAASLPSFRGESSGEETPNPKRGKTLAHRRQSFARINSGAVAPPADAPTDAFPSTLPRAASTPLSRTLSNPSRMEKLARARASFPRKQEGGTSGERPTTLGEGTSVTAHAAAAAAAAGPPMDGSDDDLANLTASPPAHESPNNEPNTPVWLEGAEAQGGGGASAADMARAEKEIFADDSGAVEKYEYAAPSAAPSKAQQKPSKKSVMKLGGLFGGKKPTK